MLSRPPMRPHGDCPPSTRREGARPARSRGLRSPLSSADEHGRYHRGRRGSCAPTGRQRGADLAGVPRPTRASPPPPSRTSTMRPLFTEPVPTPQGTRHLASGTPAFKYPLASERDRRLDLHAGVPTQPVVLSNRACNCQSRAAGNGPPRGSDLDCRDPRPERDHVVAADRVLDENEPRRNRMVAAGLVEAARGKTSELLVQGGSQVDGPEAPTRAPCVSTPHQARRSRSTRRGPHRPCVGCRHAGDKDDGPQNPAGATRRPFPRPSTTAPPAPPANQRGGGHSATIGYA